MKQIFFITLLLASTIASANDQITAWITHPGGRLDNMCRKIWSEYETRYNTPVTVFVKPGVDGILAAKDMSAHPSTTKVMCHGNSMWVQNRFVHTNIDTGTDNLEMLIKYSDESTVWYTPNNTPAKSLDNLVQHLRSLNRPVNVGVFTGVHRLLSLYIEKKYNIPVNIVSYKRNPDLFPQLADGSLDLAFDAGGGTELALAGRFRIQGYGSLHTDKKLSAYRNFYQDNAELAKFSLWLGLTVPKSMSSKNKQLLAKRVELIVSQDSFREYAAANHAPVSVVTDSDLSAMIAGQIQSTASIWKKLQ